MVSINVEDLSNDEQLDLIDELWESLRKRAENDSRIVPVSESQKKELDARLDAFERGQMPGSSLDETFDAIRARRQKP